MEVQMTSASEVDTMPGVEHECPQCGARQLQQDLVKSAFWHDERLVVVDDIPAVVCEACGERFYDDTTITLLDLMQGDGFPSAQASGHLHVPVFSFSARIPIDLTELTEEQQ
jgi:YgiT-type zinc finger domain-containing protein